MTSISESTDETAMKLWKGLVCALCWVDLNTFIALFFQLLLIAILVNLSSLPSKRSCAVYLNRERHALCFSLAFLFMYLRPYEVLGFLLHISAYAVVLLLLEPLFLTDSTQQMNGFQTCGCLSN